MQQFVECAGHKGHECATKLLVAQGFMPPFKWIGKGLLNDAQILRQVRCGPCARAFRKENDDEFIMFPAGPGLAEMRRRREEHQELIRQEELRKARVLLAAQEAEKAAAKK